MEKIGFKFLRMLRWKRTASDDLRTTKKLSNVQHHKILSQVGQSVTYLDWNELSFFCAGMIVELMGRDGNTKKTVNIVPYTSNR